MQNPLEMVKVAKGIDPVADAFAGTVNSDVYNMGSAEWGEFMIYVGVGATGTSTLTVEACDDFVPTNTTAVPFTYKQTLTGDTEATVIQKATAAGFATTAGSSKIIRITVHKSQLGATGFGKVRLHPVEVVDSPVLGDVHFRAYGLRYTEDINATLIA